MTAATPGQPERDHAEWLKWAEANGYANEYERDFHHDDMRHTFIGGMNAARAAVAAQPVVQVTTGSTNEPYGQLAAPQDIPVTIAAQDARPAPELAALQLIIAVDALRDIADEPHPGYGPERATKALDDIGTPGFAPPKPAPELAEQVKRELTASYIRGRERDPRAAAEDEAAVMRIAIAAQDARPAPGDSDRLIDWAAKLIADAKRVGVDSESWHNERQDWLSTYKATPRGRPAPGLAAAMASLAAELHAEADRLAPPDWPADHDRIIRARERHECAARIARLTGSPQSAPPALAALTARWLDRAAVCDRDAGTARNSTSRAVLLAEAALFREFAAEVREITGEAP